MVGNRFLVLGSGVTGKSVSEFFLKKGIEFRVSSLSKIDSEFKEKLSAQGISFEEGKHSSDWFEWADYIVLSPSVRKDRLPQGAQSRCISELDLAQEFFPGEVIAITGTNGKTTTVSMLAHVLSNAGMQVMACGNIGLPFISVASRDLDAVVVEVSSFQLFNSSRFRPDLFAVLNITPDHLDWHNGLDEYALSKLSPIKRISSSHQVFLNQDSPLISTYYSGSANWFKGGENEDEACVYAMCEAIGIKRELIETAIKTFSPPHHRISFVGRGKGLVFLNDSKATNPASTFWALRRLSIRGVEGKVVLLCGGKGKGLEYSGILNYKDILKGIVGFGQEGPKIVSQLSDIPGWVESDLEHAFNMAVQIAEPGDVVLLSPMCASFDQYTNYKERGEHFEKLVLSFLRS